MSARRLLVLVAGLPHDSAVNRAVVPERAWPAYAAEELLAVLVELVDEGNRLFGAAHSKEGRPHRKPVEVLRPADIIERAKPRRQSTPEELARFFGGAVRYTGPRLDVGTGRRRCARGHFVGASGVCARCG